MFAAVTSDLILAKATPRDMNHVPQSGARSNRRGGTTPSVLSQKSVRSKS